MALIHQINGNHGTYLRNLDSILAHGFKETIDHNEWLGDGAYFFIQGIWDSPIDSAKKFAEDTRYKDVRDNLCKEDEEICVLDAVINVDSDKYLDLDNNEGLELFNMFREELWAKIAESGKKPANELKDCHILMVMRSAIGIEFVKRSLFIKFGLQRRVGFISSLIPNVTIFVVNKPVQNIENASIKRVL